MPRVFIVDDHPIMRLGVSNTIVGMDGWELVGEYASVDELLVAASPQAGDAVVLDLLIGGSLTGVAAVDHLAALGCGVVVLTALEDRALAASLVAAGAREVVLKGDGPNRLVAALGRLATNLPSTAPKRQRAMFTARERDVLQLIGDGLRNRQIANELGITESTVKRHIESLMRKTGRDNRAGLATLAAAMNRNGD
jgi:DNA-binding NarL/FixJ family response regulator